MLLVPNMITGLQTLGTDPVQNRSSQEIRSEKVNPALSRWVVDIGKTFSAAITVIKEGQSHAGKVSSGRSSLSF